MVTTIGFDGDDTLWHNETAFSVSHKRFAELLSPFCETPDLAAAAIYERERINLAIYGYGVKAFTLSMIETALQLTEHRIGADEIGRILQLGKDMLAHPVDLLDGVRPTLEALRAEGRHRMILVTKGDLFDQESKVARSGLADLFDAVEIVSEKDRGTYERILKRHGVPAERFLMVGNAPRSDILPVRAIGGHAAYVPYAITWAHEMVELDPALEVPVLDSMADLPDLLKRRGWA